MKTLNSLSGGKTSSYIAVHYPADYNVFALVTTTDKECLFPDEGIRKIVSDKIGREFIGTLEMDETIYTILDLEQFIGKKIDWVVGRPFDEIIQRKDKIYLPNKVQRFCTIDMKLKPIMSFWYDNIREPIEMRIGFRANEMRRAKSMLERTEEDGFVYDKFIVGKHPSGKNKWQKMKYQSPRFPLIENGIFKDEIEEYWKDKPVRFAYMNNCVGCFHRNPILLKHMATKAPNKFEWFCKQERNQGYENNNGGFITGMSYDDILKTKLQIELFDDDFNECDSGYCGL
jgi:hypothetical protein